MAVQPMSVGAPQTTPFGHGARVATVCGKSQGQFPLFSQLRDGVCDLFVDFEYATSALNHLELEFLVSDLSLGLKRKDKPEISVFSTSFPHHGRGRLNGSLILHIQCGMCKDNILRASLLDVWNPKLVYCS